MHPKQLRAITRSPKAMMRYQTTGQVPRMVVPRSPLIELLEKYTPRDRLEMRGVRLVPALGYAVGMTFCNAEQLYRWLKPSPRMLENEAWPAESHRIKQFHKTLAEQDLIQFCQHWPEHLKIRAKQMRSHGLSQPSKDMP